VSREHDRVIGIVLKAYPRLSETFIVREILMLEGLGLKLHIFAMRNPGERAVHDDVRRVRARVTYIPDRFWGALGSIVLSNLRLFGATGKVYGAALRHAIRRSIRERSVSTLKRFFQAGYLVQRGLPGTDVAHFHAHFGHDPTTVAFFASWLSGIRYSFSAHAKDIFAQDPEWLREKIARAKFVVTCTEHNRAFLEQLGGASSRVFRCYHGVQPTHFVPSQRPSRTSPRLLSVGRLVPKKGFGVLLQSLAMLKQRGTSFRCTIVGGGPLGGPLRDQIRALGLEGQVELLPPMSQAELIEHYRTADLFVLACEVQGDGDRDGIPNVIVEALAMEIPVVSTRVSGIPECVEDGVNGILVPEKDPRALADGIARLLAEPELARAYGRAGRRKIESEFDALRNVKAIDAALRESIDHEGVEARYATSA
jgi:glycosyltransferase involved in cell wall biosynthesis